MALTDWQLIIYAANADAGAGTAYNDVGLTTIAGYSGYTTTAIYIVKPEAHWLFEFASIADVSGATFGKGTKRRAFNVESYPFRYNDGGNQDLDNIDTLAGVIAGKPYLWARLLGGSRKWPNTTNTAHPVNITNWSEAVNSSTGTRRLNLTLEHRYKV
jgi:hypothetical protein